MVTSSIQCVTFFGFFIFFLMTLEWNIFGASEFGAHMNYVNKFESLIIRYYYIKSTKNICIIKIFPVKRIKIFYGCYHMECMTTNVKCLGNIVQKIIIIIIVFYQFVQLLPFDYLLFCQTKSHAHTRKCPFFIYIHCPQAE